MKRQKCQTNIVYPDLASSSAPILHSAQCLVPKPPIKMSSSSLSSNISIEDDEDLEYILPQKQSKPHVITEQDFNDLIRDLNLPKSKVEILGSRLKQWNLLADVNVTYQRNRHEI
ncbi:hypothetical protein ABEB36_000101 [Hypothenemus hampei]|uniref:Uncharacterized protein n=1 Tax=Hypothenemus hampei TaxID=57062 RepID=A0ABD1FAQ9_HYPHA